MKGYRIVARSNLLALFCLAYAHATAAEGGRTLSSEKSDALLNELDKKLDEPYAPADPNDVEVVVNFDTWRGVNVGMQVYRDHEDNLYVAESPWGTMMDEVRAVAMADRMPDGSAEPPEYPEPTEGSSPRAGVGAET